MRPMIQLHNERGTRIQDAVGEALFIANKLRKGVFFEFNGIRIEVNPNDIFSNKVQEYFDGIKIK